MVIWVRGVPVTVHTEAELVALCQAQKERSWIK